MTVAGSTYDKGLLLPQSFTNVLEQLLMARVLCFFGYARKGANLFAQLRSHASALGPVWLRVAHQSFSAYLC